MGYKKLPWSGDADRAAPFFEPAAQVQPHFINHPALQESGFFTGNNRPGLQVFLIGIVGRDN